MPDFLELPDNPTIFSMSCDVSKGEFSCIDRNEAFSVANSCENKFRKNVVTCKDEHLAEFVSEVQGLKLDTKLLSNIGDLPYYIPVFDEDVDIIPNLSHDFPFVGLSLKNILPNGVKYKAGCLHEEKSFSIRMLILQSYCFRNKKVLLFSSGTDTLIESIWHKRIKLNFFNRIPAMGFYAATGFNFSLITGECPFGHALNMKRSLKASWLYEQAGLSTIPHIYALTKFQVKRWSEWLKEQQNIDYFCVNCQLQSSRLEHTQIIQFVKAIFALVPNIHAILQGFPIDRVGDFEKDVVRIHYADSAPLKKAKNFRKLIFDPQTVKLRTLRDDSVSKAELITHNFEEKRKYLNHVKQQIIINYKLENKTAS